MLKCDKNRVLPKIILKYVHFENKRRHEFCNPDTILVFIIIGAETRPCVVSRGPIHLFYFQVCLLSLFCIKSYLCIWYVREGKILVNLDVAWLKGNMKMFFKKWFLAWFINPVSVELQLTLETKFEWAISNLSGNNGKNGSALESLKLTILVNQSHIVQVSQAGVSESGSYWQE